MTLDFLLFLLGLAFSPSSYYCDVCFMLYVYIRSFVCSFPRRREMKWAEMGEEMTELGPP